MSAWRFNGDYRDLSQVDQFITAYNLQLMTLEATGRHPYNDSFLGSLGGTFATLKDERTAIYLCQGVKHLMATALKVNEAWDDGCRPITVDDLEDEPRRHKRIVHFGWYMDGSGFQEWQGARMARNRRSIVVFKPRARTSCYRLDGAVMAR